MSKLTQSQREQVRLMFGGRCAYCGGYLPERWHADHVKPVVRLEWMGQPTERPENHCMDNIMPACPPCNISKGSMELEVWRAWLAGHIASLNAHNTTYRLAKAYGLLQETGDPVLFHFETAAIAASPSPEGDHA